MNRDRWPVMLLSLVAVLALMSVFSAPAAQPVRAAPSAVDCAWQNIGTNAPELFHSASAFDTDNNVMYLYGGAGKDYSVENTLTAADMSAATLRAQWASKTASAARSFVGAAGAYRAKGTDSDLSAAYFFGGMSDPLGDGSSERDVQRWLVKAGQWERLTVANTTAFDARSFASAAYDPVHDVIWVVGGIGTCKLTDVLGGASCNARPIATNYLSWDATTGEPQWNTLASGNQSYYAATMVYDAPRSRMLIFGGTANITRGRSDVVALDLSDADPANAKFTTLTTAGNGPSTYFHGTAFFASQNWLVAYGGVRANFVRSNETVETTTYGLDLTANPPTWVDLKPTGSPGTRVGGVLEYDPVHNAAVFALGRDKSDGDPATVEKINRVTWGLTCTVVTPSATTPAYPPPPTTPVVSPSATTPVTPIVSPTAWNPPSEVCALVRSVVPPAVQAAAVASPASIWGYQMLCQPSQPASPWNVERKFLGLENPNRPFNALYNTVVWKCGCP